MRSEMVHSETPAKDPNGARLPARRLIYEAIADVEEGLEFWETIAGKISPQHRVSREFLNRQG
jgi:hypothetical protein